MPEGVKSFEGMRISATGLTAQRLRMDVLAENVANASTTRTEEGGPYRRKVVTLRELGGGEPPSFGVSLRAAMAMDRTRLGHLLESAGPTPRPTEDSGVVVDSIEEDPSVGPLVYDPTHPDADEAGYVQMPNVELVQELMELTSAARLYEANLAALRASQEAAQDTLRIMR
jgi:flagellar basal-body rod protein FlgC